MKISTTQQAVSRAEKSMPIQTAGQIIGIVEHMGQQGALVLGPLGMLCMVTETQTLVLDQEEAHAKLAQSRRAKTPRKITEEDREARRERMKHARTERERRIMEGK